MDLSSINMNVDIASFLAGRLLDQSELLDNCFNFFVVLFNCLLFFCCCNDYGNAQIPKPPNRIRLALLRLIDD